MLKVGYFSIDPLDQAKGAGELYEDAERGHYLALLDRVDDLFLDAGLLGEVPDAPAVVLAVHLYPLACLVFLAAHVAFRFSGPECSIIDEKADRPFPGGLSRFPV